MALLGALLLAVGADAVQMRLLLLRWVANCCGV